MYDHSLVTISLTELGAVSGGAELTFEGQGTSTRDMCFKKIGRGIAHAYGLTGPWKPESDMRTGAHLLKDQDGAEMGVARWKREAPGSLVGTCKVAIY